MSRQSFLAVVLLVALGGILAWLYWPETPLNRVHRLLRRFDSLEQRERKFDPSLSSLFADNWRESLEAEWDGLGPEAIPALVEVLNDNRYPMRYLAARRLAEVGDPGAVPGLIRALRDHDSVVRSEAADALGEIGDHRAVEPLIHCLEDDENGLRSEAAMALGKCRDERGVEPLIRLLHHESWWTRVKATVALGCIGDRRAADPIRQLMDRDETDSIQKAGKEALRKLGAGNPGCEAAKP